MKISHLKELKVMGAKDTFFSDIFLVMNIWEQRRYVSY